MLPLSLSRRLTGLARVPSVVLMGCVFGCGQWARAQIPPHRVVLLSGQEAPGTPGLPFDHALFPQIDDRGRVAFYGALKTGNGVNGETKHAIWGPAGGADLGLIARSGAPTPLFPPGWILTSGNSADGPGYPKLVMSPQGQVAFPADASGPTPNGNEPPERTRAVWSHDPAGGMRLLAKVGDVAPDTGGRTLSNVVWGSPGLGRPLAVNRFGNVALHGEFLSTTRRDEGVLAERAPGDFRRRFMQGDEAPGTGGLPFYPGIGLEYEWNDRGQVAVRAPVDDGSGFLRWGIWSSDAGTGALHFAARELAPAPDVPGARFQFVQWMTLGNTGTVAFHGITEPVPGAPSSSRTEGVWWRPDGGETRLLVRKGQPAPGLPAGQNFFWRFTPLATEDGGVLFRARTNSDGGIWHAGPDGNVQLLVREKQPPPGWNRPGTLSFTDPTANYLAVNPRGDLAFTAYVEQNGFINADDYGAWSYRAATKALNLIVRVGQTFEVAPGDTRTVSAFTLQPTETGFGTGLNDTGKLAMSLSFTDNTNGVFVFDITGPQPGMHGDANLDGSVNGSDFALLAGHFGRSRTVDWNEGDFNLDGSVNGTDFALLAANFGRSAAVPPGAAPGDGVTAQDWLALEAFGASVGVTVPEPAAPGAAAALAAAAAFRRRPRRARPGGYV